jgi:hypothetical protein
MDNDALYFVKEVTQIIGVGFCKSYHEDFRLMWV